MENQLKEQLDVLHQAAKEQYGDTNGMAFEAGYLAGLVGGIFESLDQDYQKAIIDNVRATANNIGKENQVH